MNLQDKTIVITGAGQGLGQNMAETLSASGARIALVDLNEQKLYEAARLCSKMGGTARTYALNVANESAVEQLFDIVQGDFGSVDGLINNAGANKDELLVKAENGMSEKKMSLADFNKVIAVDLAGVFLCAREAAVRMIRSGHGGVIDIISNIPLKRLGEPAEISQAALFIFQNNYYNGRVLEIDGGLRM